MKKKYLFIVLLFVVGVCLFISRCKTQQQQDLFVDEQFDNSKEREEISDLSIFQDIYRNVYGSYAKGDNIVTTIVERFGQAGFVAIDCENQINMTCSDKLLEFIRKQEAGEEGEIQVIQISYHDGFSLYNLLTKDGDVYVNEKYYSFINGQLTQLQEFAFKADVFYFTDEGYLMIEGLWYSPEQFVLTLSEEEEHIAFRVYPLEDKYREMCSKYIAPVSYGLNNLFLTEWNTKDYSNLDFYDIFEKFYQETYKVDFPYIKNEDWSVGNEYFVPSREFENVIMQHFQVTQNELRKLLRYDSGKDSYIFRPRGNEEFDYAHIPYPEVVSYTKNDDGSLTLCVYAVFPNDNTSKKFVHEVTIQDENGKIIYLSNHILENQKSSFWWHADRYTDEAWKEYYGR